MIIFPLHPLHIPIIKGIIILDTIEPLKVCLESALDIGAECALILLFELFTSSCLIFEYAFFHLTILAILIEFVKYVLVLVGILFVAVEL